MALERPSRRRRSFLEMVLMFLIEADLLAATTIAFNPMSEATVLKMLYISWMCWHYYIVNNNTKQTQNSKYNNNN